MSHNFLDQFARLDDAQVTEVARRIAVGENARAVGESIGLDPVATTAAVARVGLGPAGADGPMLVQAAPAHPRLAQVVAQEATVASLFPDANRADRLAMAAGLLQILDDWEASHTAAQEADDLGETATSAAWHMVAHRREPDPSNARYWARRVNPAVFAPLGKLAAPLLANTEADSDWARHLVGTPGGTWNPSVMIDLCGRSGLTASQVTLARRLQRLEMLSLLGASTAMAG